MAGAFGSVLLRDGLQIKPEAAPWNKYFEKSHQETRDDYAEIWGRQTFRPSDTPESTGISWQPWVAPATLFFAEPRKSFAVGSLTFDVLLTEDHAFESTVTSHPVENGSLLNDHIRKNLRVGSLRGLVSNYSISVADQTPYNRAQVAYDLCRALWEAGELVTVVTCLETYENVAITSITTSRSFDAGESQEFDITFQEVKVVNLERATLSVQLTPRQPTTTPAGRRTAVTRHAGRSTPTDCYLTTGPQRPPAVGRNFILEKRYGFYPDRLSLIR